PAPPSVADAPAPPGWRALVARGDVDGALVALEAPAALDDACRTAPATDLMVLADAARSGNRAPVAIRAYRAVRERFAGTDAAATAAFHLGQIAFDQGGSLGDARSGFSTYLAERPSGPLAQEALGRLLEVEDRAHARAAARSLAQRYLERFPNG